MTRFVLLAVAWLALLPACAEETASPGDIRIFARAVEIAPGELNGLTLLGTVSLHANHKAFGGFSGLSVRGDRLTAVSDRGWWLEADLAEGESGLFPLGARLTQMRDSGGEPISQAGGDAEGLTMNRDRLLVSFERDHRVMEGRPDGRLGGLVQDRRFERLRSNKGLEALATLPDGSVLAIAEEAGQDGYPMFRLRSDSRIAAGTLPAVGSFSVTGADLGPDGQLYVLLRDYSPLRGVRIAIIRYPIGTDGLPEPSAAVVLASYGSGSGIDNMEGISLWTDRAGRVRMTLISDDNFNFLQRTLLMDFEVPG